MISIVEYKISMRGLWNDFNDKSINSLFMFNRNYMDYHKDRFIDSSYVFYDDDTLIALFPGNIKDDILYSHGGLTFGGFIVDERMKQHTMNECMSLLLEHAKMRGIRQLVYKCIPQIYCNQYTEADQYSLYANGAVLKTIDVSTYVNIQNPIKMPKGRKAQISRARRENVLVEESVSFEDFECFIKMENEILTERHNTKAVHTARELKMLRDRFPSNIHLFVANKGKNMIAGVVVYEYQNVIHTQYMMANEEARRIGALDLIIASIIDCYKEEKQWLDFGISTEHNKMFLNEGLCSQKEGFGGRTGIYKTWVVEI